MIEKIVYLTQKSFTIVVVWKKFFSNISCKVSPSVDNKAVYYQINYLDKG